MIFRKIAALFFGFPIMMCLCPGCTDSAHSAPAAKEPVVFMSGGTIDDHVASILLFTMDGMDYRGSITTNSDCLYSYAMQNQWKVQSYVNTASYPITLSEARGWNPFPMEYRKDSIKVYNSAILTGYADNPQWPAAYISGERFLREQLTRAIAENNPVTLLITNPLTPLSTVLKEDRALEKGIRRVIWMGGAINVAGNLDPNTLPAELANPKAEWNAYWDPYAVDWIFKNTSFPLIVFPLDVTDQAKLTPEFMTSLKTQGPLFRYSNLVLGLYSLVEGQPYFEMWNSLTSVYLARPDIFDAPVSMRLVIETEGYMQGSITQNANGRQASVILNIKDKNAFYDYVIAQLRRN
ncbi:MAG: nucleoside hydrolase [Rhodoferax sp.]